MCGDGVLHGGVVGVAGGHRSVPLPINWMLLQPLLTSFLLYDQTRIGYVVVGFYVCMSLVGCRSNMAKTQIEIWLKAALFAYFLLEILNLD